MKLILICYDAMLEASELETPVDTLRVDKSDGRCDDAEEGDEQSVEGGSHHPYEADLALIYYYAVMHCATATHIRVRARRMGLRRVRVFYVLKRYM